MTKSYINCITTPIIPHPRSDNNTITTIVFVSIIYIEEIFIYKKNFCINKKQFFYFIVNMLFIDLTFYQLLILCTLNT